MRAPGTAATPFCGNRWRCGECGRGPPSLLASPPAFRTVTRELGSTSGILGGRRNRIRAIRLRRGGREECEACAGNGKRDSAPADNRSAWQVLMRGGAPASCARTHSLQTGPGAPCARPAKGDGRFTGSPVRFLAGQTHVSRNQRCSRGLPVTGTVAVRRTPRTRGCRCCARLRARGTGRHGNRGGPGHRARWLPNFRPSVYSTVTDFARFRGLSTSRPSATAAW